MEFAPPLYGPPATHKSRMQKSHVLHSCHPTLHLSFTFSERRASPRATPAAANAPSPPTHVPSMPKICIVWSYGNPVLLTIIANARKIRGRMLDRVTADEIVRQASSGRTKPILVFCEVDTDEPLEVFCKLSAGCIEGVGSLAREVVAACLAADLELPVPTSYLVEIPSALVSVVADPDISQRLKNSSSVGFGSEKVDRQFNAWTIGSRVTEPMLHLALGALVFDAVIENADRRAENPNCLTAGDRFRLIDHELAFPLVSQLLDWRPPWRAGGLRWLDRADGHIFCRQLKRRQLDFGPLQALWSAISDARLMEYRNTIPPEWDDALPVVEEALDRIRSARDNFDGVITEIRRVLQ